MHALICARRATKNDTFIRVFDRAVDKPSSVSNTFRSDQNSFRIQAVQQILETFAPFSDQCVRRNLEIVVKDLTHMVVRHNFDFSHLELLRINVAHVNQKVRKTLERLCGVFGGSCWPARCMSVWADRNARYACERPYVGNSHLSTST
jgi:hypothetical protein